MIVMFIDADRSGYAVDQVEETMTLAELAKTFERAARVEGEDVKVYLRHDDGYTYGGITAECLEIGYVEDDE